MTEVDVEIVIQGALEKYPGVKPRIISDNGSQYISKDFKAFVLEVGKIEILLPGTWYRAPAAATLASLIANQASILGLQVAQVEYPGANGSPN